jgi:hypothetical protein
MPKSLQQKLFEKPPTGKAPPQFVPKVVVRVQCPRTKQTFEFSEGVAIEGHSPESFDETVRKLRAVFEKIGILPRTLTAAENNDGTEKEERPGTAEGQQNQSA